MSEQDKLSGAYFILDQLEQRGYEAVLVGGYVRNRLLGIPIHDVDIATSAKPSEVIRIFDRTVPTGLQHGTVTVLVEDKTYEVTTFRTESGYDDHRHPTNVEYVQDLQLDLSRRDFTINAMAVDKRGHLIDPFDGKQDLNNRIIRAVGNAKERFHEDALRMLRALRFAAEFEFTIDPLTWSGLNMSRPDMRHVAMERVRSELERMIEGSHPDRAIELLLESRIYKFMKTDIGIDFEHLENIPGIGKSNLFGVCHDEYARWAMLFILAGNSAIETETALRRLTFSKKKAQSITSIVAFHELLLDKLPRTIPSNVDIQALIADEWRNIWVSGSIIHGVHTAERWLTFMKTIRETGNWRMIRGVHEKVAQLLTSFGIIWLNGMPVKELRELAVNGRDLLEAQIASGQELGDILKQLLLETALGNVTNDKSELLRFAESLSAEQTSGDENE